MVTPCLGNISAFPGLGGPEVLELVDHPTIPDPGPDEVRIKVLTAGTGFTINLNYISGALATATRTIINLILYVTGNS
jgi:hypothetical protein